MFQFIWKWSQYLIELVLIGLLVSVAWLFLIGPEVPIYSKTQTTILQWVANNNQYKSPIILFTAFCVIVLLRFLFDKMRSWIRTREFIPIVDGAILTLFCESSGYVLLNETENSVNRVLLVLSALLLGLRVTGFFIHSRKNDNIGSSTSDQAATTMFDTILGDEGFAALTKIDPNDDTLNRLPFVNALIELVGRRRGTSTVFGLEGPWGAGKTTIFAELQRGLENGGALVVRFDAWNFREPNRVVSSYFEQIQSVLKDWHYTPKARKALDYLSEGLGAVSESKYLRILAPFKSKNGQDLVSEAREDLKKVLHAIGRPVIILVDDLERLDSDEARAALRAIRLISELPYLTHVLAYDRVRLIETLFPESGSTSPRARDYLAKIINIELTVNTPPSAVRLKLIEKSLTPVLDLLTSEERGSFSAEFNTITQGAMLQALPTPREIRRVTALTAWTWLRLRRGLNFMDLFVLVLIKLRFPEIYHAIHHRPELFYNVEWSSDWMVVIRKDKIKEEREDFIKKLQDQDLANVDLILRLLDILFPGFTKKYSGSSPSKIDARKKRRAIHPDILPRYLQFTYLTEEIPESSIEDLVAEFRGISDSKTQTKLLSKKIKKWIDENLISSLFDQWDLFLEELGGEELEYSHDHLSSVVDSLMEVSPALNFDRDLLGSSGKRAAARLCQVIGLFKDNDQATNSLVHIINDSPSLLLAGHIMLDVRTEAHYRVFGDRTPTREQIEDAFENRILNEFKGKSLLESDKEIIPMAIFWSNGSPKIADIVYRDIKVKPDFLATLVGYYLTFGNSPFNKEFHVIRNDLRTMHQRLDPSKIHNLTKHLQLDSWSDKNDQKVVELFRKYVEEMN